MINVLLEDREEPKSEQPVVKEQYNWRYENSISNGKKIELNGDYSQWRTNTILCKTIDPIFYVNEMNINPNVTDQMHYDYLYAVIRKQKRWSKAETKAEKKAKEEKERLISLISDYYKYNTIRAKEALKILTKEQIEFIKEKQ